MTAQHTTARAGAVNIRASHEEPASGHSSAAVPGIPRPLPEAKMHFNNYVPYYMKVPINETNFEGDRVIESTGFWDVMMMSQSHDLALHGHFGPINLYILSEGLHGIYINLLINGTSDPTHILQIGNDSIVLKRSNFTTESNIVSSLYEKTLFGDDAYKFAKSIKNSSYITVGPNKKVFMPLIGNGLSQAATDMVYYTVKNNIIMSDKFFYTFSPYFLISDEKDDPSETDNGCIGTITKPIENNDYYKVGMKADHLNLLEATPDGSPIAYGQHGGIVFPAGTIQLQNCHVVHAPKVYPDDLGFSLYFDHPEQHKTEIRANDAIEKLIDAGMCTACASQGAYAYLDREPSDCGDVARAILSGAIQSAPSSNCSSH
ncbi:hypothetical protein F7H86_16425 (plasmid) [Novacetimonas hansenii]|uniref:hypothetical protein n=1 Tax=Novacetimonas hansenii TaxID=436 RepID=UPI003C2CB041